VVKKNIQKLTAHEKYRRALTISNKISELISNVSHDQFTRKMKQLESIYQIWSEGKELSVVTTSKGILIKEKVVPKNSVFDGIFLWVCKL